MTTKERDRIVRKIQACLAMAADGSGASDTERETALRHANHLADEWNITIATLADAEELGERGEDHVRTGSSRWKVNVVAAVADLYGLATYRTSGRDGITAVIGREAMRRVVLDMAAWVSANIDAEAARVARDNYGDRRYMSAWRKGAAYGIWRTVWRIQKERKAGETTDSAVAAAAGSAMVLVEMYASELACNDEWMRARHKLGSGSRSTHSSGDGYRAGSNYGAGIGLNSQMGQGRRRLGAD